jgi:thymidylate synthase (FAD)
MATAMLRVCKPAAPLLFADAGPGCLAGTCPEGKMTCGQAAAVRQEFQEII